MDEPVTVSDTRLALGEAIALLHHPEVQSWFVASREALLDLSGQVNQLIDRCYRLQAAQRGRNT